MTSDCGTPPPPEPAETRPKKRFWNAVLIGLIAANLTTYFCLPSLVWEYEPVLWENGIYLPVLDDVIPRFLDAAVVLSVVLLFRLGFLRFLAWLFPIGAAIQFIRDRIRRRGGL
jgi:hypothetical protein